MKHEHQFIPFSRTGRIDRRSSSNIKELSSINKSVPHKSMQRTKVIKYLIKIGADRGYFPFGYQDLWNLSKYRAKTRSIILRNYDDNITAIQTADDLIDLWFPGVVTGFREAQRGDLEDSLTNEIAAVLTLAGYDDSSYQ